MELLYREEPLYGGKVLLVRPYGGQLQTRAIAETIGWRIYACVHELA
jgi:hypothetical protein